MYINNEAISEVFLIFPEETEDLIKNFFLCDNFVLHYNFFWSVVFESNSCYDSTINTNNEPERHNEKGIKINKRGYCENISKSRRLSRRKINKNIIKKNEKRKKNNIGVKKKSRTVNKINKFSKHS